MSDTSPPPPGDPAGDAPRRKGRKVRVDFRRNIGKVARDKRSWTRGYHAHKYEHTDTESDQSVRAKGALSRKRTIVEDSPNVDRSKWIEGIVTAVRGLAIEVDAAGRPWMCWARRVLRSRLIAERQPIAVGDRVMIAPAPATERPDDAPPPVPSDTAASAQGEATIEAVLPRTTTLVRQYEDRVQVLAANIDQAIIVASPLDPPLRPHLLDRFIVAAHKGDMRPLLCINKLDIDLTEEGIEAVAEVIQRYEQIGYRVLRTSAQAGAGIDDLRAELKDRTSVIVGMSGVGKSSLLNAVQPGLRLRTGEMDRVGRGQHTTTTAELLRLDFGGYVVDTPGIRQFELAHIEADELEALFPEFIDRVAQCRFSGCRHLHESGCAIRAAAESGEIHPERYESFVRMLTGSREGEY